MTTIQPHTRWVPSKLMAAACMATCMLLSATAAQAGTPASSPATSSASTTSHTARSATTARAAAAHTLASRTRALHACERVHPRDCAAAKRAVERAARGLHAAQAHPAGFAGGTRYYLTAPTITVSGDSLSWRAIGRVHIYVLARRTAGQSVQTSIVTGTSTTPPAVPGATVLYSVRTGIGGSASSAEVAISYPAAASSPPASAKTPTKAASHTHQRSSRTNQ